MTIIVRVRARGAGRLSLSLICCPRLLSSSVVLVAEVPRRFSAKQTVGRRDEEQRVERGDHQPADQRPAQRSSLLYPFTQAKATGEHGAEVGQRGHDVPRE